MSDVLLNAHDCLLLLIDMQDKFAKAMPTFGQLQRRIQILAQGCATLQIPILVSEQYPQGLGHTSQALKECLPTDTAIFEKNSFGCGRDALISEAIAKQGKKQILICGIETHICVSQTAHQLLSKGYQVHLVQDATESRKPQDREIAISKMYQAGVIPQSIEMALFELMQHSKSPAFKEIQALVK